MLLLMSYLNKLMNHYFLIIGIKELKFIIKMMMFLMKNVIEIKN